MDKEQLELLEEFVDLCRIRPSVLKMKELKFFREWLLELGATLPASDETFDDTPCCEERHHPEPMEESASSNESDVEISNEGVIDKDEVTCEQFMGDVSMDVTEEMQDESDLKRGEALSQFREGNFGEAITLFNEAIKLNPTCAMLYAKRASCYVKMRCPNAAIKDCNRSFELNPDSALAYKWRGISYKLLGKWEEAFTDLTQSLKLDYSDDGYEQMKDVETKAKLIREHRRKYERRREEKLQEDRRERVRRAQEANEKAKKSQSEHQHHGHHDDCGDHHSSGAGEFSGGLPSGLGDLLSDPELVEDLKDPEVMAALTEIMSNPASLLRHQGNPKISKIMNKMQAKFSGGGAAPHGHASAGASGSMFDEAPPHSSSGHKANVADDLD